MRSRALGVLLVLGSGCGGTLEAPGGGDSVSSPAPLVMATRDTPRLRVLTFNVNFGVADRQANLEAIEAIDADVVMLQEVTAASESRFRDTFADRYPHILFRDCCRAGGLGILSKHPIVDDAYLEPDVGWFPAWLARIDSPIGEVQVLDVHLRPPVSDSGSWAKGYFSTRETREQEMQGFFGAIDPDVPVIVAGDFNEGADGRAVAVLAGQDMRSALAQVDPKADTWHWPLRVGELRSMLDHIVYDKRLALLHAEVQEVGVSDHYPVFADFARAQ